MTLTTPPRGSKGGVLFACSDTDHCERAAAGAAAPAAAAGGAATPATTTEEVTA